MRYFMLNPECYLVKGAVRGAIYNLHTGNVFSIGPDLVALLTACDVDRTPVDEALAEVTVPRDDAMETLERLRKERLGRFYETEKSPPLIEKLKPAWTRRQKAHIPPVLRALHLELTGECDLNCVFCDGSTNFVRRKHGCARWPADGRKSLRGDDWKKIISDGEKLGCQTLVFVGGDPLLAWEDLSELILFAKAIGYEQIKVETNGCRLDEARTLFFKEHDVLVSLQILSFKEPVHDEITRVPGSCKKMMQNLDAIVEHEVARAFVFPVVRQNEGHLRETMEWFDGYDAKEFSLDVIGPGINDDFEDVVAEKPEYIFRTPRKPFGCITAEVFFKHAEYHPCFHGRITVTRQGDILPCPLAREEVIGNILEKDLPAVFRDRDMDPYWYLTKDAVEVCRDCEYRYACLDCRPMERSLSGKPNGRSKLCSYNPYKGEWTESVSKVKGHVSNVVGVQQS